ncbi:hypothetical protein BVI2075_40039 [Burkholderia vietnamiensis]|nr:hypothetical protein BVI2075_40039 [Burkholderia vietnamiensis]
MRVHRNRIVPDSPDRIRKVPVTRPRFRNNFNLVTICHRHLPEPSLDLLAVEFKFHPVSFLLGIRRRLDQSDRKCPHAGQRSTCGRCLHISMLGIIQDKVLLTPSALQPADRASQYLNWVFTL